MKSQKKTSTSLGGLKGAPEEEVNREKGEEEGAGGKSLEEKDQT